MTDMSADIPKEQAEKYGIKVLPFYINYGDESILADVSYTPGMFYEKFKSMEELPSTSQATPDILEDMYRSFGKENQIIHITIPANSSGIVNTAKMVAAELADEGFDKALNLCHVDTGRRPSADHAATPISDIQPPEE